MRCLFRILLGVLLVSSAEAATSTVTTLADSGAGSLRQALADSAAGDTITFAVTGTITLTSGELVITNSLTIAGPGATNLAVSGNSVRRVFRIGNPVASVTISGLTICNGKSADGIDGDPWSGGPVARAIKARELCETCPRCGARGSCFRGGAGRRRRRIPEPLKEVANQHPQGNRH